MKYAVRRHGVRKYGVRKSGNGIIVRISGVRKLTQSVQIIIISY